ncbi:MAG: HAD family hydrolase [Brachybacterium alimentarium]
MLLLLDLDNTLIDRDDAFARWAAEFLDELGGGPEDLNWLLKADGHGYTHRAVLADGLRDRLGLTTSREDLVQTLLLGHAPFVRCYSGILDRLAGLRAAGTTLVVVTNGVIEQQTQKLQVTGLDAVVDRVIISEAIGVKKPDPTIFAAAIEGLARTEDPWMVGDHAEADISGGRAAGCRTGWVSHGRRWAGDEPPAVSATTTLDVLDRIEETERAESARPDGSHA